MIRELIKSNDTLPVGLDIIRVISGLIIFSFGWEMFNSDQMAGYFEWLTKVGMPLPTIMAYIGKSSELICGLCLALGLYTRLSAIPLMITMCVINFIMLDGNIRTDSFYLLLIFTSFFFIGGGKLSIDSLLQRRH